MRLDKPVLRDPLLSQRSPFEVFLLVTGVFVGWAVLIGVPVSSSLQSARVEPVVSSLWGGFTFGGSLLALAGMFMPQRQARWMVLGLHVERFGLTLLAGACFVFAWLLWARDAYVVAGQNAAFAAACVTRVVQIARRFSWYYREGERHG